MWVQRYNWNRAVHHSNLVYSWSHTGESLAQIPCIIQTLVCTQCSRSKCIIKTRDHVHLHMVKEFRCSTNLGRDSSVCSVHCKQQHTLTGRFTPRPHSCSFTSPGAVSHQVIACITPVGSFISKCCSSSVINLAIGWVSQSTTIHNC